METTQPGGSLPRDQNDSANTTSLKIRTLNDAARKGLQGVTMTIGVQALGEQGVQALLEAMRRHDKFEPDDDPYGEHDFGVIERYGEKFFWKIDYYDQKLEYGSADPANPDVTRRVITLMRADEY